LKRAHIKKQKQLDLNIYTGKRGGRRPDSGRNRIHSKGVSHRVREKVTARTPVHINFKVLTYIQNKPCLEILHIAITKAQTHGLYIIYFALQSNHIHFIAETKDNQTLTKGMRSLTICFAKRIQQLKKVNEPIQIERYHLHVLKNPKEVENALNYVIYNEVHHTGRDAQRGFSAKVSSPSGFMLTRILKG
jgi:REP element-mobilizing transposase RayT